MKGGHREYIGFFKPLSVFSGIADKARVYYPGAEPSLRLLELFGPVSKVLAEERHGKVEPHIIEGVEGAEELGRVLVVLPAVVPQYERALSFTLDRRRSVEAREIHAEVEHSALYPYGVNRPGLVMLRKGL